MVDRFASLSYLVVINSRLRVFVVEETCLRFQALPPKFRANGKYKTNEWGFQGFEPKKGRGNAETKESEEAVWSLEGRGSVPVLQA